MKYLSQHCTLLSTENLFGLCNIFTVLYYTLQVMLQTGALFFGQSEIKLAFSVFPHCSESGMRTPLWRTGWVWNALTTQSKAASVKNTGVDAGFRYLKAHMLCSQQMKKDCDNLTCLLFRGTASIYFLFPPLRH